MGKWLPHPCRFWRLSSCNISYPHLDQVLAPGRVVKFSGKLHHCTHSCWAENCAVLNHTHLATSLSISGLTILLKMNLKLVTKNAWEVFLSTEVSVFHRRCNSDAAKLLKGMNEEQFSPQQMFPPQLALNANKLGWFLLMPNVLVRHTFMWNRMPKTAIFWFWLNLSIF